MIDNKHKITLTKLKRTHFWVGAILFFIGASPFIISGFEIEFNLSFVSKVLTCLLGLLLLLYSLPVPEETKKNREKMAERFFRR